MKFQLVNPCIEGSIKTKFKGETSLEAANNAYEHISKYFSNNVPKFLFSLKKGEKYYHFIVSESINKENKLKYVIKHYNKIIEPEQFTKILSSTNNLKGGKRKMKVYSDSDSDSSSSSSSSAMDKKFYKYKQYDTTQPITYWTYYPYIYSVKDLYMPTFIASINPYVSINMAGLLWP